MQLLLVKFVLYLFLYTRHPLILIGIFQVAKRLLAWLAIAFYGLTILKILKSLAKTQALFYVWLGYATKNFYTVYTI